MQQARSARDPTPIKAAISAQLGLPLRFSLSHLSGFAILSASNWVRNFIKPAGQNSPYWLVFPHYDVKNRVDLNFAFDQPLTDFIDEYVHEFRPTLLRGKNGTCLFPGEAGQSKHSLQFSKQITLRIQKAVGIRITVHQFRHAAAAIFLKDRPGDYTRAKRLLGHRDVGTTERYYCGLETLEATQQFGKLIRQQIKFDADS